MTALERWRYADPEKVYERIEQAEQKRQARSPHGRAQRARAGIEQLFSEERMTPDESDKIEQLLETWYDYETGYTPKLGAPRMSVSCRDFEPTAGDTHDTGSDRDELLARLTAEAVGACIDELPYLQRAAISVHCRNKQAGMSIHRNPRIEDQHAAYQEAKAALAPLLRRKGLLD